MSDSWWRHQLANLGRTLLSVFIISWFVIFGGMIVFGWDNLTSAFRGEVETGREEIDCRQLEVDITFDRECERSDDCVFTRDEYAAFKAKEELYRRHCEES